MLNTAFTTLFQIVATCWRCSVMLELLPIFTVIVCRLVVKVLQFDTVHGLVFVNVRGLLLHELTRIDPDSSDALLYSYRIPFTWRGHNWGQSLSSVARRLLRLVNKLLPISFVLSSDAGRTYDHSLVLILWMTRIWLGKWRVGLLWILFSQNGRNCNMWCNVGRRRLSRPGCNRKHVVHVNLATVPSIYYVVKVVNLF